ncbi:MAG: LssY C-terminal domain-containing protein [Deltaproteobacteria bacterium]|nr:LssY C-terminal domain-containing protein [Deltaproteobacteria bacterium]
MKIYLLLMRRLFIIGLMICLALFVEACATFEKPVTTINEQVHERALTKESNGIRVSAAVVGTEEAREIFGIDLFQKNIQAVWLEIENNSDRPLILLPTALDPEYFAPLEVAYAYHKTHTADANAAIGDHLLTLNFPIRSPILPGSSMSGYVFTNRTKGMKVIDVDVLGRNFSQNFTFFAPNPDGGEGQHTLSRMETMFSAQELKTVVSEVALRQALEQVPCCVSDEDGTPTGEPLNVVIIGEIDDWISGFVRRGYQYQPLNPRYAFGRPQDISGQKHSRGYSRSQEHFIRIWKTPILYDGKPVWIAQTSTRLGERFTEKVSAEVTIPLDPYVDHARNDLTQDLAYSQALIKIGYVKGSGRSQPTQTNATSKGAVDYITDGLRVVLVFAQRPTSLADIDFFDWERLADYH